MPEASSAHRGKTKKNASIDKAKEKQGGSTPPGPMTKAQSKKPIKEALKSQRTLNSFFLSMSKSSGQGSSSSSAAAGKSKIMSSEGKEGGWTPAAALDVVHLDANETEHERRSQKDCHVSEEHSGKAFRGASPTSAAKAVRFMLDRSGEDDDESDDGGNDGDDNDDHDYGSVSIKAAAPLREDQMDVVQDVHDDDVDDDAKLQVDEQKSEKGEQGSVDVVGQSDHHDTMDVEMEDHKAEGENDDEHDIGCEADGTKSAEEDHAVNSSDEVAIVKVLPAAKPSKRAAPPTKSNTPKKAKKKANAVVEFAVEPHPRVGKWIVELEQSVAETSALNESYNSQEEEDYRLGLEKALTLEEVPPVLETAPSQGMFPTALAPLLGRVVQGSAQPLTPLAAAASALLLDMFRNGQLPETVSSEEAISASAVADKIKLLAERKAYGSKPKNVVIFEDETPSALWRWDVTAAGLLSTGKEEAALIRAARAKRTLAGNLIKALMKVIEVMKKTPEDEVKVAAAEEAVTKFMRKREAARVQLLQKQQKETEKLGKKRRKEEEEEEQRAKKAAKEEEKKVKEEERKMKEEEKKHKEEEKKQKEEEKKRREEAEKKATEKASLFNFFKKEPAPTAAQTAPALASSLTDKSAEVTAMELEEWDVTPAAAPTVNANGWTQAQLDKFNAEIANQRPHEELLTCNAEMFAERIGRQHRARRGDPLSEDNSESCSTRSVRPKHLQVTVSVESNQKEWGGPSFSELKDIQVRNKMISLAFAEDARPPYWGTWSKTSSHVTGRTPLGKESKLNYDVDSEEEWEEEEPGEDLLSEDEEDKEPDDGLDYQDGWLRRDGEFSDGEIEEDDEGGHGGFEAGCLTQKPDVTAVHFVLAGEEGQVTVEDETSSALLQYRLISFVSTPLCVIKSLRKTEQALFYPESCTAKGSVGSGESEAGGQEGNASGSGGGSSSGSGNAAGKGKAKLKEVPADMVPELLQMLHGKGTKVSDVVDAFVAAHPTCSKKAVKTHINSVASRERSIAGGTVWVVKPEVLVERGIADGSLSKPPPTLTAITDTPAKTPAQNKTIVGQSKIVGFFKVTAGTADSNSEKTCSPPGRCADGGWIEHKASPPPSLSLASSTSTSASQQPEVAEGKGSSTDGPTEHAPVIHVVK